MDCEWNKFKDNKEASEATNSEVKKLLDMKTPQSTDTHRKAPVSQDIGTLFYDGEQDFSKIPYLRQ